jgi:hypothetical protein
MSLSDIMGHLDLTLWPKLGLVVFLAVFIAACIRAVLCPRRVINRCAHLPLDEGVEGLEEGAEVSRCQGVKGQDKGIEGFRCQGIDLTPRHLDTSTP